MNDFSPEAHLYVFLCATRIIGTRLEQAFSEANAVTGREATVLALLSNAPDHRMRIDKLSQEVIMDKSTVSRIVDRLVRAGYVERRPSLHDRRAVYAAMTSEGRNALRHVTRAFRAVFEDVFLGDLDAEELALMTSLLNRLYLSNTRKSGESGAAPVVVTG
jgi:DNA-binding MarR family transcriptional regulator